MTTLAERASAMAAKARAKAARPYPDQLDIARDWWLVTTPADKTVSVFMHPAATAKEMGAIYPGCKIVEV
jgi:hypothetical protein